MNNETGRSSKLAAYLAIHHHRNDKAMLFPNMSFKVKSLLAYVALEEQDALAHYLRATKYRTSIRLYHDKANKVIAEYKKGKIDAVQAERQASAFMLKAKEAHKFLMRLDHAAD